MKHDKGDQLEITDRKHGHGFPIGQRVTITKVCRRDYDVENKEGEEWSVRDSEVKLVKKANG